MSMKRAGRSQIHLTTTNYSTAMPPPAMEDKGANLQHDRVNTTLK
jgi:hypothetical protein